MVKIPKYQHQQQLPKEEDEKDKTVIQPKARRKYGELSKPLDSEGKWATQINSEKIEF